MNRCAKCNRPLTKPPIEGMGPTCAKNMLGAKPRVARVVAKDEKTVEMFPEVPA